MDNSINEFDFLSNTEIDLLRGEALNLYDHCLVERTPIYMVRFIERQLSQTPPRLQLLRGIADDLQQRLFTLRDSHFDVREKVVNTFQHIYDIDITPVIPPDQLDSYHEVNPNAIIDFVLLNGTKLGPEETKLLMGMIRASCRTAAQLQADINLTSYVRELIADWLNALSIRSARYDLSWLTNDFRNPMHDVLH